MFTKDRKVSYFASKISDNISETAEGYLICHNVPIARTGVQEYLGQELGISDKYDEYIKVYREPEDVFASEALASFEGKPFTDNHPEPKVDINNITQYSKGHAQNLRRSTEEPDLLLADIIVTDPLVISEIKNGVKREISSGYDCYYVPYKDGYRQVEIRGNHIALVSKGRAGDRVSIKDNKVERKKKMAKKNILAAMFKSFARDAEPEELAEALEVMAPKDSEQPTPSPAAPVKEANQDDDPLAKIIARLDDMEARLSKLYSAEQEEGHPNLDEDPEELIEDEDPEIETEDEDPEDTEDSDEEEQVITSKDSLDSLKMAVARIRNPKDKKRVSDALAKVYRKKVSDQDIYGKLQKLSNKAASARLAKDSANNEAGDLSDLGRKIAAKYNPHYKEN